MGDTTRWEQRRQEKKEAKRMMMSRGILPSPPKEVTKGDYVGLCILVQFPNVPGTIPQFEVENFCNKPGYTGFGNSGSVNDYYSDVSKGLLNYTNEVTSYYTAKNPRAYYTDPNIPQPVRTLELILEALEDLKSKGFDFSILTADTEGFVYALNVFYAGPIVNNWAKGLWPHSWHLTTPFETGDGRKIYDYQITNMGEDLTLGTFCHENGHMICSFPDLYDYGYESNGDGNYCLMSFGGSDEKNPVQICAYLKAAAGWAENVRTLTDGKYTAIAETNEFFKIAKNQTEHQTEYYLIECRNQENRDKSLPSSGLAIWHVDELGSNNNEQMTNDQYYECSLVQADNKFDLEHRKNYGDDKDLFNKDNGPIFNDFTKPSSRWWDGTLSGINISDIGAAGREVPFNFEAGPIDDPIFKEDVAVEEIPDNDIAGITRIITLEAPGQVNTVEVAIDITHSYIGDLKVTLVPPKGTIVNLHNRYGAGQDNLIKNYSASSTPDLAKLAGEPIKGKWMLKVVDLGKEDVGKLNRWSLKIVPLSSQGKPQVPRDTPLIRV